LCNRYSAGHDLISVVKFGRRDMIEDDEDGMQEHGGQYL
jgi:hypothetical protein